jgi:hypothetical protein
VALDGSALMLGDNISVVLNTTVPSSVLKKKHNAIAYHPVREAIAARIMRFAYIKSEENVSDVLTKPLSNEKFHNLMKRLLFRVSEKDNKKVPVLIININLEQLYLNILQEDLGLLPMIISYVLDDSE